MVSIERNAIARYKVRTSTNNLKQTFPLVDADHVTAVKSRQNMWVERFTKPSVVWVEVEREIQPWCHGHSHGVMVTAMVIWSRYNSINVT